MTQAEQLASQLNVKPSHVTAVINLLDEGNTVPFIARYRKEMTGSLDDEQIRIIASRNETNRGNQKGWNGNVQPFYLSNPSKSSVVAKNFRYADVSFNIPRRATNNSVCK